MQLMIPPARKRRSLRTMLAERRAARRFASNACEAMFDYEWEAIRFNRIAVVNYLLSHAPGADYLEIGCAANTLFDAVMSPSKVGVDPARGGTHRMTSDAYFASGPGLFDVVFIDGLHLYDQVRRDLVHALAHLKPGGWIAMHDMLPRDWMEEHVPQVRTSGWTGDGWKVAFELLESEGLEFRLVAIDHGIVVVRTTSPSPKLADLSATLTDKRFKFLHEHFARLPVTDYSGLCAWVESSRPGADRGA
jgi:hypothetical protein